MVSLVLNDVCTYYNNNFTDQAYFSENASPLMGTDVSDLVNTCVFDEVGDLAVQFDIEASLGDFYNLIEEIESTVEIMNDP